MIPPQDQENEERVKDPDSDREAAPWTHLSAADVVPPQELSTDRLLSVHRRSDQRKKVRTEDEDDKSYECKCADLFEKMHVFSFHFHLSAD